MESSAVECCCVRTGVVSYWASKFVFPFSIPTQAVRLGLCTGAVFSFLGGGGGRTLAVGSPKRVIFTTATRFIKGVDISLWHGVMKSEFATKSKYKVKFYAHAFFEIDISSS